MENLRIENGEWSAFISVDRIHEPNLSVPNQFIILLFLKKIF